MGIHGPYALGLRICSTAFFLARSSGDRGQQLAERFMGPAAATAVDVVVRGVAIVLVIGAAAAA